LDRIADFLKQIGPMRLLAVLGITGIVAATLLFIMFRVGAEERALLYSDLSAADAAAVTEGLTQAGIEYQLSPDGGTVYVPRSQVGDARMRLAAEGLPGQGSVGYEIFDNQDALGATSFVQNINKLRALEGELARSIDSLDTVRNARVHLVIPERSLFQQDAEPPTASIVVGLERGRLSDRQVQAIRNLVASAVPGLVADKVTILDERGELLAGAAAGDDAGAAAMDDRKAQYEERMRRRIQELVEGLVGPGAVRVQVSAEMDFSQVSETQETFDPDQIAPRSTRTIEETSADREQDQAVTQGQNVPDGTDPAAAGGNQSNSNRTDETVNNEISKTVRTAVTAPGQVTRLSVAVAVDGVTTPPTKAGETPGYEARSEEEMARIAALVRSAAGIDDQRGDRLEVANVQFARSAPAEAGEPPGMFSFDKNDILRAAEIGAMLLIAVAMIFFVARPLIKGVFTPGGGGAGGMVKGPGGVLVPASALDGNPGAIALPGGFSDVGGLGDESVDLARIQGAVNAGALKQISEVVNDNPDQAVQVIRGWLQERRP
jgi:flagellar M-ring protein FliF